MGVCSGKVSGSMFSWQLRHTYELYKPESPIWGGLRARGDAWRGGGEWDETVASLVKTKGT